MSDPVRAMSLCVFAGPTLPPHDPARKALAAAWLPPAQHGDVYRAVTLHRPRAIGLVDGYFEAVPAVWHKEILWALHEGVAVFGAGSMGALRAAELAAFGMRGVGVVFAAYRDGVLDGSGEPFEDDDEVAVVHGPPESGYLAASDAMVNIRCTLAQAARAGVIGAETRAQLIALAKAAFFSERSYARLLQDARAAGLPEAELAALQAWLPAGRIDQKRADALALLEALRAFLDEKPRLTAPRFHFEHTTLWERARAAMQAPSAHEADGVLDELRLGAAQGNGAFARLRGRAGRKRARLAAIPGLPHAAEFSELQLLQLTDWYFSKLLQRDMPDDLEACVRGWGYADLAQFHQAIFREYVYRNG